MIRHLILPMLFVQGGGWIVLANASGTLVVNGAPAIETSEALAIWFLVGAIVSIAASLMIWASEIRVKS